MIRICIVGGFGRMGREVAQQALEAEDIVVSSVVERQDVLKDARDYAAVTGYSKNEVILTSDPRVGMDNCDVVVDFSSAEAFERLLAILNTRAKPLVTGTTGIVDKREKLRSIARMVCVVDAPNMALGVNLVLRMVDMASRVLRQGYDIEIVEIHHRNKKDSPSGTALAIANIVKELQGRDIVVGRGGGLSERGDEVVIHSLRMDGVPGQHSVLFASQDEMIEIRHVAQMRRAFAKGAMEAIRFASKAAPGLYDMLDVLRLR